MNEIDDLVALYTEAIIDEDQSADLIIDEGLEIVGATQEISLEQAGLLRNVDAAFESGDLDHGAVEERVREILRACER